MTDLKEKTEEETSTGSGQHCEMPLHCVDGVYGSNHSDAGPLWLVEIEAPCCKTSARWVLCDAVHTHILGYLENKRWRHRCVKCGKAMSFKQAYKGSVQWG